MQRLELSPGYEISRVSRGGWQLSGSHSATTAVKLNKKGR